MATQLKRIEFKQRYPAFHQGLFIVLNSKRLPKDQAEVNIGRTVSAALVEIPAEDRPAMVPQVLGDIVASYTAVTLTHPEILFSPGFHLDVIGALLALCRKPENVYCLARHHAGRKAVLRHAEQPGILRMRSPRFAGYLHHY